MIHLIGLSLIVGLLGLVLWVLFRLLDWGTQRLGLRSQPESADPGAVMAGHYDVNLPPDGQTPLLGGLGISAETMAARGEATDAGVDPSGEGGSEAISSALEAVIDRVAQLLPD